MPPRTLPTAEETALTTREPIDLRASMVDRPGAVLKLLFARFFATIKFAEADVAKVRAVAARGPVVYVLRTVSYLEYLYFNYALAKHGLPLARFANGGVRTILLWPLHIALRLGVGLWRLARGAKLESEEDAMARRLELGDSVLLFLRPSRRLVGDKKEQARVRGHFLGRLVDLQRRRGTNRPLQLVPLTLLWGTPAVRPAGHGTLDALFGEPEAPGRLRAFLQFARYHQDSVVKVGETIDLASYLEESDAESPGRSDDALERTLRFELSGRIERERRAVLGPPAKTTRRVRQEVMRSRRLVEEVTAIAKAKNTTVEALAPQVDRQLREIAASPRRNVFVLCRRLLDFVFGRMYDGIDVEGLELVRQAIRRGPLVLLPSHKSHIDYLVLSYIFYNNNLPPPYIAAGSNLSFFPLGWIFRRLGAFFLRRSFKGDALYASVFAAYVRRVLREGNNMEFFVEGGRSRTGKLLPPKLGLLAMVADAVIDGEAPNAQAVPIAITYEKVVEEGSYAKELAGGEKKKEDLGALLRARRVLRSQYGRIAVQIAQPFPLSDALAAARPTEADAGDEEAQRRAAVRRLGHRVAFEIAQATALTPTALVAAAALSAGTRAVPREELDRRVRWLAWHAKESGAPFAAALHEDFEGSIHRAIDLLASAEDLELRGVGPETLVVIPDDSRSRLEFYKNNAIHPLGDVSIVARALLAARRAGGGVATITDVRDRAQVASRLLKNELTFRPSGVPGAGFDEVFATKVGEVISAGWVERDGERLVVTEQGQAPLAVLAGLTASYLETYRLVVRGVEANPGASRKELVPKLVSLGERALLLGELHRHESVSRPIFESALEYLQGAGALADEGKRAEVARQLDLVTVRTRPSTVA